MIKHILIFVLVGVLLAIAGDVLYVNNRDKETQRKTDETILVMKGFGKLLGDGDYHPAPEDSWGKTIKHDFYSTEVLTNDEKYVYKYIKITTQLPKDATNIKYKGNEWVSFTLDGENQLQKLHVPLIFHRKCSKVLLCSAGPDKVFGTPDDVSIEVECNIDQVYANLTHSRLIFKE